MKKIYFLFGIGLLSMSAAIGQNNHREGESVEFCRQHSHQNEVLAKDAQLAQQFNAAQANLAQKELQLSTASPVRAVRRIPVVFHVLHQGGTENISREQILDAMVVLNRDYRLQNADAADVLPNFTPADAEIEFVLATKAPDGTCFGGITRTYSTTTNNLSGNSDGVDGEDQLDAVINGNDVYQGQWPVNRYLNVIVAKSVNGAAGYTYNPGFGNSMQYNCIWILSTYVGRIGTGSENGSRALTHEVGHWLNLSHTWGPNNDPMQACGDDGVNDTPVTKGFNFCPGSANDYAAAKVCNPSIIENFQNYMDYSYCSKMFSNGQKLRMQSALSSSESGRNNLWTASNLALTGANGSAGVCAAKFTTERTNVCSGEEVTFTDESFNNVTGWSWTFSGGTPATSNAQNPTVVFNTPGAHTVTLTVTDGSGTATETKTNYINVYGTPGGLPFLESFENLSAITDAWVVQNPGGNAAWTLATNTGSSGTKSAKLGNFGQPAENIDHLISAPVDLSDVQSQVTLSFKYAYRKRMPANSDNLQILASTDCGETWLLRRSISAAVLAPSGTPAVTTDWTPSATDFVTVHITNLTSQFWIENFRYKFQFTAGGGNNIYLDDINIYEGAPSDNVVVGLDEIAEFENAVAYPNPADAEVNVKFNSPKGQKVVLTVTDLTGKVLQEQSVNAAEGTNVVMIPTDRLAAGMYLIRFNGGGQTLQVMIR